MPIRLPAVLLVRGGSQRLPRKALLPWFGETLLSHAIQQVHATPLVSRLIVATDDAEYAEHARACKPSPRVIMRPPVKPEASSYDDLRWVLEQCELEASYVLLVQCTSPFINAHDLNRLIKFWNKERSMWGVTCLGRAEPEGDPDGTFRPSGMGYIVPPGLTREQEETKDYLRQEAPPADIDTMEDYKAALELTPHWDTFINNLRKDPSNAP